MLAALAVACSSPFVGRPLETFARSTSHPDVTPGPCTGLVVCYGVLGFGYILPATFLPALAREVVDDPRLFGLAWPIFGVAAALSTVATARRFGHANRLRVWAVGHLLMAEAERAGGELGAAFIEVTASHHRPEAQRLSEGGGEHILRG